MELVYLWVENYKNIKKQGFNFSPRFSCDYNEETKELTINENDDYIENFFGDNINVTAIVGKNDFVDVEFFRLIVEDNVGKISDSIGKVSDNIINFSEQENQVIDFIKNHNRITSKNVEAILDVKEARARRILKEMVEKGLIIRLGRGRSTCYQVLNK